MTGLRVRFLGALALEWNGYPVRCSSAKSLELLCLLLMNGSRPQSRERLAARLWPDEPDASAKRYLRQALWKANAAVQAAQQESEDADGTAAPSLARPSKTPESVALIAVPATGWLRIDQRQLEWTDIGVVDSTQSALRDLAGQHLTDRQAADLQAAIAEYRGEFLAGWEQPWCVHERTRLHRQHLSMLEQMTGYCEVERRYAEGVSHGQRILLDDPGRESTHQQLMRLHYRSGDRTAAIRQFHLCTAALAGGFGIEPSASTIALYEQICADRIIDIPLQSGHGPLSTREPLSTMQQLQHRLDEIQAALASVQQLVLRELQAGARADPGPAEPGLGDRAS